TVILATLVGTTMFLGVPGFADKADAGQSKQEIEEEITALKKDLGDVQDMLDELDERVGDNEKHTASDRLNWSVNLRSELNSLHYIDTLVMPEFAQVMMAGWAWDPDAANSPSDVEIWIDGQMFQQISANAKNESLRNSKRTPDAYHGWLFSTPGIVLDGKSHTIRVYGVNYPSGAKVELAGSPKQYKMEENTAPMGGFWRADEKMLRGWAADPDLFSEPCEIEIYIDDVLWKTQKADRTENWITETGYAPDPNHGFLIEPPTFTDGKEHKITIYAKNFPEGPSKNLGTRWVGKTSIFPGFWTQDKLIDTRINKGLYVRSVSPWYNAYHEDVKVGDVLLEYDGVIAGVKQKKDKDGKITQAGSMTGDFMKYINNKFKKNDLVKLKLWRNGDTYIVEVKMGQILGR
ncbi:MAG: PDZ domain-containing protein, partial [Planctomycetes bacterium]|nr:PDZ domain-containing protein [Planctomycetota bacterium]